MTYSLGGHHRLLFLSLFTALWSAAGQLVNAVFRWINSNNISLLGESDRYSRLVLISFKSEHFRGLSMVHFQPLHTSDLKLPAKVNL